VVVVSVARVKARGTPQGVRLASFPPAGTGEAVPAMTTGDVRADANRVPALEAHSSRGVGPGVGPASTHVVAAVRSPGASG